MESLQLSIKDSLERAAGWLASRWDGNSLKIDNLKHNEPFFFNRSVVLASECAQALAYTNSEKGIHQAKKFLKLCLDAQLEECEPQELWAYKLGALRFSNCYEKEKIQIANYLQKTPLKDWQSVVSMPILTNFNTILSLAFSNTLFKSTAEEYLNWLKKGIAKDGLGWGAEPNASKSYPTFTANAIISHIAAGGDVFEKHIQTAIKFLENLQEEDGSWRSSRHTTEKPTGYATALVTIALLFKYQPTSPRIKKAINYILSIQNKDGGWPLVEGEESYIYPTYFATFCLSFYNYLNEKYKILPFSLLVKIEPGYLNTINFFDFNSHTMAKFKQNLLRSVLNSKALGSTRQAILRRKNLLQILSYKQPLSIAELLDELKLLPDYANLKKKSHLTQIKYDLDYLTEIGLAEFDENRLKYYVSANVLES